MPQQPQSQSQQQSQSPQSLQQSHQSQQLPHRSLFGSSPLCRQAWQVPQAISVPRHPAKNPFLAVSSPLIVGSHPGGRVPGGC